jgi:hypothetical protein
MNEPLSGIKGPRAVFSVWALTVTGLLLVVLAGGDAPFPSSSLVWPALVGGGVAFWVWAIVDIARVARPGLFPVGNQVLWLLVVAIGGPLIGVGFYLFIGRPSAAGWGTWANGPLVDGSAPPRPD